MMTARVLGLSVPDSFIINTGTAQEWEVLFATQHYDRRIPINTQQIDGLLKNHSADPIVDQLKLWKIIVYDYLIGNTDNHI